MYNEHADKGVTASIAWGLLHTQKKGYPNPTPLA